MKNYLFSLFIILAFFATSCEKSADQPDPDIISPIDSLTDLNGFTFQNEWYNTPFGILEYWGENNEESADYDLKFTDGKYESPSIINQDSVLVYLDLNSPALTELSEGEYLITSIKDRTPNSIVEAYILFNDEKTIKLQIVGGKVKVERIDLFFKISYSLETVVFENNETQKVEITGQYTGKFDIYDYHIPE